MRTRMSSEWQIYVGDLDLGRVVLTLCERESSMPPAASSYREMGIRIPVFFPPRVFVNGTLF